MTSQNDKETEHLNLLEQRRLKQSEVDTLEKQINAKKTAGIGWTAEQRAFDKANSELSSIEQRITRIEKELGYTS